MGITLTLSDLSIAQAVAVLAVVDQPTAAQIVSTDAQATAPQPPAPATTPQAPAPETAPQAPATAPQAPATTPQAPATAPQAPAGGPGAPLSTDATSAAPAPSGPVIAPSAAGSTVDSQGMPWDERIHASSKATVADGTWRKRRNLDAATLAAVESELRARAPAPSAPPTQQAAPSAPPPPAATTNPFQPPVQQGRPPMSVEQLLSAMSVAVAGKYIESIPAFLQGYGMTLTDLLNPANAAALPTIQAALEAMGEPE